ncbi:MAG: metallopeptidase family protein [Phycisphaerales bacterium]
MTDDERERFDALLEMTLAELPDGVHDLLEQAPLIVDDRPSRRIIEDLINDGAVEPDADLETVAGELCGLHSGLGMTERSIEDEPATEEIYLFREGIVNLAGGWESHDADAIVREEIRITLLHEIGHHFGLEEEDLADLGYD